MAKGKVTCIASMGMVEGKAGMDLARLVFSKVAGAGSPR
jgi:hypothetical protein